MPAIAILGMHRSGTSCLAGMIVGGGLASSGDAVRNWDNARGHHEMLALVRLDEAVLAYSGGHYLSPPAQVRWTAEHAAERDRLLRTSIGGRPALLKDPRMLLVLPFWRESGIPLLAYGIVRHPLAVARSLATWRDLPLAEGVALYLAHNRALVADRARYGCPVLDFELPKPAFVAAALAACGPVAGDAYEEQLVHHDDGDPPDIPGLADAIALYRELGGSHGVRGAFPRDRLAAFEQHLAAHDLATTLATARGAVAAVADPAAMLLPIVSSLIRAGAYAEATTLVGESKLDNGLGELLLGKICLAAGAPKSAVAYLEVACSVAHPLFQARHLLPHALRAAGRNADARDVLATVAREALYPHGPLATLAEWSWLDGDREAARAQMRDAIAAAPQRRRGRLRTRLAEWLTDDREAARAELERAIEEDPGYPRSRDVLAKL